MARIARSSLLHVPAAITLVLTMTSVAAPVAHGRVVPQDGDAVRGRIVVQFRDGISARDRAASRSRADTTLVRRLHRPGQELLAVASGRSAHAAITVLTRDRRIRYAVPNAVYRGAARFPTDPYFGRLWALRNTGQPLLGGLGTPDADIDAPEAWDLNTGSRGTVVAVVDSGIAYDHPDLAPNVWRNPGEVAANAVDDDHNGLVDDVHGYDFADEDADPRDVHGHGSHTAGTVAAVGNNGIGITGVSWSASLVAIRVLDADNQGTSAVVAAGLDYAGDTGAGIAVAAFTHLGRDPVVEAAITDHPGTLFVFPAGNAGTDNDRAPTWPCASNAPNVICVAATDRHDQLAQFSNYGASTVDVAAPGTQILSTWPHYAAILSEGFEDPARFEDDWVTSESTPAWQRTSEAAADGTFSATDSPGGDYANDVDTWLRTAARVDLAGQRGCYLEYALRLDVEPGDPQPGGSQDRLVVETSADGSAWTPRETRAVSTAGEFQRHRTNLRSDGEQVFLRFRFVSDAAVTADGAHLDDIRVACTSAGYTSADYQYFDGTSISAAHVAGAAALLRSEQPAITVTELRRALVFAGDERPSLRVTTVSGRRLDAFASLRPAPLPPPSAGGGGPPRPPPTGDQPRARRARVTCRAKRRIARPRLICRATPRRIVARVQLVVRRRNRIVGRGAGRPDRYGRFAIRLQRRGRKGRLRIAVILVLTSGERQKFTKRWG